MAKRTLDTAPMVGKNLKSERDVVRGHRGEPKPAKKVSQQVESEPVTDWVPPNGDR